VPNPFNPSTDILFSLPRDADVDLRIYDVAGRLVKTLVAARRPAGAHRERWDGRDDAGRGAASGVYFVRLRADGATEIKPMTLVR
jgi:flagellar hook assembly protein FlgD